MLTRLTVKALYDYAATIEEEFDFQAGDIIAVTSTPEDGWWTGECFDEARNNRGGMCSRAISFAFSSFFVSTFSFFLS